MNQVASKYTENELKTVSNFLIDLLAAENQFIK